MATTVVSEYQKISTTGTAVALASTQEVLTLYLYAPRGNRNTIHFGSSTVTATGATTDGLIIPPGKVTPNQGPCDLADSYINGDARDGVYYRATYGTSTSGITVVQPTATSLHVEAEQATASELKATVYQDTAADLKATVYQGDDNQFVIKVLLEEILEQLKSMNIQLSSITDNELEVQ